MKEGKQRRFREKRVHSAERDPAEVLQAEKISR